MSSTGTAFSQSLSSNLPNARDISKLAEKMPDPFQEVVPALDQDKRICREFFMFTCPFCFAYHDALSNWGSSLPLGWAFEPTPILVGGKDSVIQVQAFYAAKKADPDRLYDFMKATYVAIQNTQLDPSKEDTWRKIVSRAGVNMSKFGQAWAELSENPRSYLDPLVDLQSHYSLQVTPTVTVGGKYLVTPENVQGDESLFIQLLNGMVSKIHGGF